ncbi:serine hydrolase [Natronobacterium gregoryi]|uniref:Beta-lactamase n=2 Tax=Natronobacterium gregoryi TaxID=44930 RepID=L0AE06_NATGS|nr:serine hydrolase [Natronobacterium gregoryi]AFZ72076.1 penicillin-binding protein, beta-lactamase class C [Natronobacterium gregoryi SP2]ELY62751.1 beta-lactamase [Natronobacterium gregoryi SP2]PLK20050.1 serine hydrolase [Natronobacterium gregoryi SP2]SFJ44404.1 CubicO group peptidase, beta-lactamase class C family [Natronobacterium gregoryi]
MTDTLESTTIDRIDSLLRERMYEDDLPGLSLAVTDGDDVVYARGYGSRDLASNAPATPETVYGIGSVSKSFAALATARLVDSGDLSYDDRVTDYLEVDIPDDVSIHHLLSHTAGYPSLAVSEALIARQLEVGESGVPLGSLADVYAHVEGAREEIAGEPGDRWMYCNTGYTLVGEVIAAVTGRSYTEYVTDDILEPLGMDRSTYDGDVFESFEDRMTPYFPEEEDDGGDADLEPAALPIREQSAAAGGLLAPVTDLANYLRLHINEGVAVDGDERQLVGEDALEACYGAYAETPSGPYGYGWRTREVAGRELIGHGGSIVVSTAYAGFAPEDGVGVALLANASPGYGLAELGKGVFAALVGEDPREVSFFARKRRLEELAGEYETYRGITEAKVQVEGGTLRLRVGGPIEEGSWTPLVPVDLEAGEFYAPTMAGNRQPVRFERDGDDLSLYVDRWRLHQQ